MASSRLVRAVLTGGMAALAAVSIEADRVRGQEAGTVAGRVLSTIAGDRGEPVPGVTLRLSGVDIRMVTNDAGRFRFRGVPEGSHELRAELLGCLLASRTVRVRAGESLTLDLRVSRPAIEVPGIVVTGVSAEAPESQRTYAVGEVEVGEEGRRSGRSIADLIRGEFPSVRVRGSGMAGEELSIQLRGPSSISGSQQPLVVIDGIITTGDMVDINPGDVANVRVLKGAAAAAEYGSRGEAGVIEITTGGTAAEESGEATPLVLVDGEISDEGLAGVDPGEVVGTELITGARAAVLFGGRAAERGVLKVTTRAGDAEGAERSLGRCARPPA